jgi:uncharacterized membrane protein HdeD (DUF308 family)
MVDVLARNWGWVIVRGVAALLFGVLTLVYPSLTLATLVLLFGAYVLVDGIFTIVWAVRNRRGEPHWVALLISGIVSVILGVLTFVTPQITGLVLLYFIALWAIIAGASQIVAAIRLRKAITGEWLLGLAGILSLIFGVLVIAFPGAGALAVALWIGAYATVLGIVFIALGIRLRNWRRTHAAEGALRTA